MTYSLALQAAPQGSDNWATLRTATFTTDAGRERAHNDLAIQQEAWMKSQQFPNHKWRIQ